MSSFSLTSWLLQRQRHVDALLSSHIEVVNQRGPAKLAEAMRYSLMGGGKRLRPILCLAFAEATTGTSDNGGALAADAACALEYIHSYSLVHDDLPAMDDDDLRRGQPTNHKVYGEAMAILTGDALLADAFALLAHNAAADPDVRGRLIAELALAAGSSGMAGGQALDIAKYRPIALDCLLKVHRMKTGALFKAACRMGTIAGRGNEAMVNAAGTYGEAIGIAFQIADDILDVTSSAHVLGKPAGADAVAGRVTFPAIVGLEAARGIAHEYVIAAVEAVKLLEPKSGPLEALAYYASQRSA